MSAIRYALINDQNIVENVILWSSIDEYQAPEGLTIKVADDHVGIGWELIGSEWFDSNPPEPEPIVTEDVAVTEAKFAALQELTALGISETYARIIVGLPPL
ncbi:hypothetical protein SEA_LEWANDO_27 [Arthrobacter phage Lewando]|nr:hypothetical protein SEA_LEWANDO_27 [Arthrobacter phage Lewando]